MNAVVGLVATSDDTGYDGWGERRGDVYDLGHVNRRYDLCSSSCGQNSGSLDYLRGRLVMRLAQVKSRVMGIVCC